MSSNSSTILNPGWESKNDEAISIDRNTRISRAESEPPLKKFSITEAAHAFAFSNLPPDAVSSHDNFDFSEENDCFTSEPGDFPALRESLKQILPHLAPTKKSIFRKTSEPGTPYEVDLVTAQTSRRPSMNADGFLDLPSQHLPIRSAGLAPTYSNMFFRPKSQTEVATVSPGAVSVASPRSGSMSPPDEPRAPKEDTPSQASPAPWMAAAGGMRPRKKKSSMLREMNMWAPTSS